MMTLSPGLTYQCTLKKTQDVWSIEFVDITLFFWHPVSAWKRERKEQVSRCSFGSNLGPLLQKNLLRPCKYLSFEFWSLFLQIFCHLCIFIYIFCALYSVITRRWLILDNIRKAPAALQLDIKSVSISSVPLMYIYVYKQEYQ